MFFEHHALLMEKCPRMGLDLLGESILPSPWKPLDPNVSILYALKIDRYFLYFQAHSWLKEDSSRKLVFFEKNRQRMISFLSRKEACFLLQDEQVYFFSDEQDLLLWSQKFPVRAISIFPHHKSSLARKLLKMAATSYSIHVDFLHGDQILSHFFQNSKQMASSFYANALRLRFSGTPAVICGAGPSLQEAMPDLKQLESRALLMAGGSAIAALSHGGVRPHFCLAADPNFDEYLRLKNSFCFEVPFLYSTRVFPAVFQTCNGPFGYLRSGMAGNLEEFLEKKLGLTDPSMSKETGLEGNTITLMALGWARFLGCNPIILAGVDLAYAKGARYAPGVEIIDQHPADSVVDMLIETKDRRGGNVVSAIRWLSEQNDITRFARRHPKISFWNTTERGLAIPKIPYRSLSLLAEELPCATQDLRFQVHQAIQSAKMPAHTEQIVQEALKEFRTSLDRTVDLLAVLAGEIEGKSKALAEFDLKEEIAYNLCFAGRETVYPWVDFLLLARQYQKAVS